MPHYIDSQIYAANHVDLAAFLISRGEMLKQRGNQMLWAKHQVWIDGCRWYSHYEAKGGYAIKLVMQYFGLSFQDAIKELLIEPFSTSKSISERMRKSSALVLPNRNISTNRIHDYLVIERHIDPDVIEYFIHENVLYEDDKYHNCIFVGLNEEKSPRHCHRRSSSGNFKQTVAGSQAEYSFHHNGVNDRIYVFEAPIDMLAYISLHKNDWQNHSYVALCSVSERALLHQLKVNPTLNSIVLCLDNDIAGQEASTRIKQQLYTLGYSNVQIQVPINKDWDEDLKQEQ